MDFDVHSILDAIEEGIIVVDQHKKILMYNKSARRFFGLEFTYNIPHGPGRIEPGDWVILGDNCLGMDDGQLTAKDL